MKDWIGNKKSTFSTLGASSHSADDRAENDYYATEPRVIDELFEVEKFSSTIWEPACGEGHLSEAMQEWGKDVFSTDIVDRGYGSVQDFFTATYAWHGDIITNPPYKYAQEFVEHALTLINKSENVEQKVAMFLKLTFLEGKKRAKFFKKHPPARVYVYSTRRTCAKNGKFDKSVPSAACYAWFVWVKGVKTAPVIHWLE